MAAFTSQDRPILLDRAFLSNTTNTTTTMFSPWLDEAALSPSFTTFATDALPDISIATTTHESSSFDNNTTNEADMREKQKQEISSTLLPSLLGGKEFILSDLSEINVEISGSCPPHFPTDSTQERSSFGNDRVVDASKNASVMEKQTRKTPKFIKRRNKRNRSCQSSAQGQEEKDEKQKKCSCGSKEAEEKRPKAEMKQLEVASEEPSRGYVHVRARRGEATDSHSLAERVRRGKIRERMKVLEGLVPGCQKVAGKAAMLDEIINYVQLLHNQVVILSTRVQSLNAMLLHLGLQPNHGISESERLTGFTSSMATTQVDTNNQATVAAIPPNTTETFPTTDYHLPENPTSILLHGHGSNAHYQGSGNLAWDVREQRERSLLDESFLQQQIHFSLNK